MAVSSTQEKRGQKFLVFFKGAHISMKTINYPRQATGCQNIRVIRACHVAPGDGTG